MQYTCSLTYLPNLYLPLIKDAETLWIHLFRHPKIAYCSTISSMPRQVDLCSRDWHSSTLGQYSIQVLSPSMYWYLENQRMNPFNCSAGQLLIKHLTWTSSIQHHHVIMKKSSNKLTSALFHLCKYPWMSPWWGRFFLLSGLKESCSVDNWEIGAVDHEDSNRDFLESKHQQLCMNFQAHRQLLSEEFPHYYMSVFEGETPTFFDAFQDPQCVNISGQILEKLFHSHFVDWGQTSRRCLAHCSADVLRNSTFTRTYQNRFHHSRKSRRSWLDAHRPISGPSSACCSSLERVSRNCW